MADGPTLGSESLGVDVGAEPSDGFRPFDGAHQAVQGFVGGGESARRAEFEAPSEAGADQPEDRMPRSSAAAAITVCGSCHFALQVPGSRAAGDHDRAARRA